MTENSGNTSHWDLMGRCPNNVPQLLVPGWLWTTPTLWNTTRPRDHLHMHVPSVYPFPTMAEFYRTPKPPVWLIQNTKKKQACLSSLNVQKASSHLTKKDLWLKEDCAGEDKLLATVQAPARETINAALVNKVFKPLVLWGLLQINFWKSFIE